MNNEIKAEMNAVELVTFNLFRASYVLFTLNAVLGFVCICKNLV